MFDASKDNKVSNIASRFYAAGDDVWKVMNYEIEKKKLLGIVQKAAIKDKPLTMKAQTVDQQNVARAFGLDPNNVDLVALSRVPKDRLSAGFINRYGENPLDEFLSEEAATITKKQHSKLLKNPRGYRCPETVAFR